MSFLEFSALRDTFLPAVQPWAPEYFVHLVTNCPNLWMLWSPSLLKIVEI